MKPGTGALLRAVLATIVVLTPLASGCGFGHSPSQSTYKLSAYWTGGGIPGGGFERPFGIAVAPSGDVFVTDARDRVVKLSSDGAYRTQWGHAGDGPGTFSNPVGVAVARDGGVYVADYDQDRVQKFTSAGEFLLQFGSHGAEQGQFRAPSGIAVGDSGEVYVADFYNSRIQEFTPNGKPVRTIGYPGRIGAGALHYPTGVAVLGDNRLLTADAYNYELQWFAGDGRELRRAGYHLLWLWPRPAEGDNGFNVPTGVAVGPNGLIHVADSANHRVVMLSPDGRFIADWRIPDANSKVYSPEEIAVAPDGSTVYATDFAANRVIVLSVRAGL